MFGLGSEISDHLFVLLWDVAPRSIVSFLCPVLCLLLIHPDLANVPDSAIDRTPRAMASKVRIPLVVPLWADVAKVLSCRQNKASANKRNITGSETEVCEALSVSRYLIALCTGFMASPGMFEHAP